MTDAQLIDLAKEAAAIFYLPYSHEKNLTWTVENNGAWIVARNPQGNRSILMTRSYLAIQTGAQ